MTALVATCLLNEAGGLVGRPRISGIPRENYTATCRAGRHAGHTDIRASHWHPARVGPAFLPNRFAVSLSLSALNATYLMATAASLASLIAGAAVVTTAAALRRGTGRATRAAGDWTASCGRNPRQRRRERASNRIIRTKRLAPQPVGKSRDVRRSAPEKGRPQEPALGRFAGALRHPRDAVPEGYGGA
jgi:hypothetical protein